MILRCKSIIMTIIVILTALILISNCGLVAINPEYESLNFATSRDSNHPRDVDYDWGPFEVISEPIPYQDWNLKHSSMPSIAVEDGKIYVVWKDEHNLNNASEDRDIFYKYFDGSVWSNIEVISEPIPGHNFNTKWSYNPKIAVENGKIYVVWQDSNNTNGAGGDTDIHYRCNLTGSGWEDIQVISEPVLGENYNTEDSWFPSIDVENGKIYVVWSEKSDLGGSGTDWDIFYRCDVTGSGWEDIQIISEPSPGSNINTGRSDSPIIAVENNDVYVVWSDSNNTNNGGTDWDIFYRANITGNSWEPVQLISEPIPNNNLNGGRSITPDMGVNNNNISVVWFDETDMNGAGVDGDIFFRSNSTGSGWGNIQVISEPSSGNNFNVGWSVDPKIEIENGKNYAVWTDKNHTGGSGGDEDILYRCNLTGDSWEDIQVISEPVPGNNINKWWSEKPDIAVNFGKSYVVWHDISNLFNKGNDYDIFFRCTKNLPPALNFPSVVPTSGNTSTYFNFTVRYNDADNDAPTEIIVDISGTNYTMIGVDKNDKNYCGGKIYYYNNTHLDIGLNTCKFWTSDGTYTKSTELLYTPYVYNTIPKIITENNFTAIEDTYYEVIYEYEDMDVANVGQTCNWKFFTNADWLIFNTDTAVLYGTPTDNNVGEDWVDIVINDTLNEDHTNFTITIIDVNDNPIINTNNIEIAYEDAVYF
ncbi:MAG: hypothetical protein KAJ51_09660, partial [Thermoplasmata archaeon]|nr:hypothetical protein [Thermoplasmata archaeon]